MGSHLTEQFSLGAHVTVIDNLSRPRLFKGRIVSNLDPHYNLKFLRSIPNVEVIEGDISDQNTVKEAAKGAELIIHTAAQVAVTTSLEDPMLDFHVNALGTLNVLEAARLNDSMLEFCSTNKVYGENVNQLPVREDKTRYSFSDERYVDGVPETFPVDLTGHSPYGCSKLSADMYMQDYAHTYGLKTGVFRFSCIYGPRQIGVEDQGWVAWLTIATLTGKPINIYGDGKQVRDVLYVTDLVEVFRRFAESPLRHGVFNVGGGPHNTLSLVELLDMLEEITGKRSELKFKPWRAADQKVYISDIRKVENALEWHPRTTPREGVESLVEWVRQAIVA